MTDPIDKVFTKQKANRRAYIRHLIISLVFMLIIWFPVACYHDLVQRLSIWIMLPTLVLGGMPWIVSVLIAWRKDWELDYELAKARRKQYGHSCEHGEGNIW